MNQQRLSMALATLLVAGNMGPAIAEDRPPVEVTLPAVTLAPGGSTEVVAKLVIREGLRLQANPTTGPQLLPTMLLLEPSGGIHAEGPVYPAGKLFHLNGDETLFPGYWGTIEIRIPIKASSRAKPGDYTLNGRLRYQPASLTGFLNEATQPVQLKVRLKGKK